MKLGERFKNDERIQPINAIKHSGNISSLVALAANVAFGATASLDCNLRSSFSKVDDVVTVLVNQFCNPLLTHRCRFAS